jgi:hypothetical protein
MMSLSDELKERNILKLILIARFACATLDVGHPIHLECSRYSTSCFSSFQAHQEPFQQGFIHSGGGGLGNLDV